MAYISNVVGTEERLSISREPVSHRSVVDLVEQLNITEDVLDIDEVIRCLNDEYRKVKESKVEHVEMAVLSKSNSIAAVLRNEGKEDVEKGLYLDSLIPFSESISYAEEGSAELALAYRKRAASLFELCFYNECVDDANRALNGNCPDSAKKSLEKRRINYFLTRRKARANGQVILKSEFNQTYEVLELEKSSAIADIEVREKEWRDMCKFDNPSIPNASSKIRLGNDVEKWGRYLEATEDLEPGEVIASQKVFAIFLRERLKYDHCSYCTKLCIAMIPCQTCSQMMYCSEDCRKLANESYHRLECKIMRLVFRPESVEETEFRAVRELLIGTEQGAQLGNLMQRMTVRDIMATDFLPSETFVDDYATALRLDKTYHRPEVLKFAPFAARMIETLEYVGFFSGDPSFLADPEHEGTLTEAQIFTAFLLLNHMVGMDMYLYHNTVVYNEMGPYVEQSTVSSAYCTLYSVFNHSCNSNISIITRKRELAFITNRPIRKGDELTITYCDSPMCVDRLRRSKQLLEKHGFVCKCEACFQEWPTINTLGKIMPMFYFHIKQRRAKLELKTLLAPIADELKFKSSSAQVILRLVLDVCKWLHTNIKLPSHHHEEINYLVFLFMSLLYGVLNRYLCLDDAVEDVFEILSQLASNFEIVVSPPQTPRKRKRNNMPS